MENDGNAAAGSSTQIEFHSAQAGDEVDLIDLWIEVWRFRKLMVTVTLLVTVVGIACLEYLHDSKPVVRVSSLIEIPSYISEGRQVALISPYTLASRIEKAMLPDLASMAEFDGIQALVLASRARVINRTNMVEIETKATPETADTTKGFHQLLVDQTVAELNQSPGLERTRELGRTLAAKTRILELKTEILTLESQWSVAEAAAPNQAIHEELIGHKKNLQLEIEHLLQTIDSIEVLVKNLGPRVSATGRVQQQTVGLVRSAAYALIFFLSLFVASLLVIVTIFFRKAGQRMIVED